MKLGHPDCDHCFIAELYYLFPVYQEFQQDIAQGDTSEAAVSESCPPENGSRDNQA